MWYHKEEVRCYVTASDGCEEEADIRVSVVLLGGTRMVSYRFRVR